MMQVGRTLFSRILITVTLLVISLQQSGVTWSEVPSIRCGQITSIVSLTTSSDTATTTTDQTATYNTPIAATSNLKYGLSLMSYESWMTDTFSFNISMVEFSNTSLTVRFLILDNTFFTKAKVHYLIVWRAGTYPNDFLPSSPPVIPTTYNWLDVQFGCYLTDGLLTGTGNRSLTVGGNLFTSNYALNVSSQVTSTTIAGMQLTNNVGVNDFVKVETSMNNINSAYYIYHNVTVENNNFLKFVCVTTVIYDPGVNQYYQKTIIQHQVMTLTTTNDGLATVAYAERYDGPSRMFFGFSQFNLSMSDTRYLNVETSNISLVGEYYRKNTAMQEVIIDMIFMSFRTCTDQTMYYDPATYTCMATCPVNAIPTPAVSYGTADFLLCNPCHYSCDTCSTGQDGTTCTACLNTNFRTISSNTCPCDAGYADNGTTICATCDQVIPGCVFCDSKTVCTSCDNVTYTLNGVTNQCSCMANYHEVSGYCLSYSGCLEVIQFNNTLACTNCDTSLNYARVLTDESCTCNEGYFLNSSTPECYDICGDGVTALGHCDDGNLNYGDGCDQLCAVETGYHCTTTYNGSSPGLSSCILITSMTVSYLYSHRKVTSNKFSMYFSISPVPSNLTTSSFDTTNFVTNMPVQNIEISYDPDTAIVMFEGEYLESLEGNNYTLTVTYANYASFYAEPTVMHYAAKGINAKLVLETQSSYNSILPYIIQAQAILAIILAIFASVVGLKLAGLQLLVPIQLLYFSLATVGSMSSYSSTLSNLKYSNGYSVIANYDYSRTYSQNSNLVAITYESQFLLSTNIMLGIFSMILVWLLVHNIRIKCKESTLESFIKEKGVPDEEKKREVNSDESDREMAENDEEAAQLQKPKRDDYTLSEEHQLREDHHYSLKIFSFEIDRAYFIFYVILVNQMLFGFTVMSLNLPLSSFFFSEQLSVIICNFLTFILLGNIVFILYDQTSNKMINFTCINDRYAYLYFMFDLIIILVLVYTFQQSWSVYVVTALTLSFVVLVIVERPYSKSIIQMENMVALYLAFMLLFCQVVLCVMVAAELAESMNLILTFLIVVLILVGEILTVIRIILRVNFKKAFDDIKNPKIDRDSDEKAKTRVREKNLDLLGKDDAEILPPDSVRNGLFTPKDKMIDWEARNTEEYESMCVREGAKEKNINKEEEKDTHEHEEEEPAESKENKFNQLELLKKRLRNTLKVKREAESKKTD